MTATVDLRPDTVNLDGYAGDTLSLRVTVADPAQVEGGVWLAQVKADHEGTVAATFDITEQEAGSALLTLDAETTTTLGGGFTGRQWDGDVAEVIGYNRVLTDPERLQVEGYLSAKWGL